MSERSRSGTAAAEALASGAPGIYFELERFERGDGDRVELAGRWFGIRGRRFVRPTLTALANGDRIRALADLEHKPWAADDGELWRAAFAWPGSGQVDGAELAVAPDLAIELPALGKAGRAPQRIAPLPRAVPGRPAETAETPAPPPKRRATGAAELERLRGEVTELRGETERARAQLAAAESERGRLAARLERAAETIEELRQLTDDRTTTHQSAQRAAAERDAAIAARDRAETEREAALTARDRALADRDRVAVERDRFLAERNQLAIERDQAVAAHAAGVVMRNAVRSSPAIRHERSWITRLVALALLVGALIACAIVLRVF